MKMSQLCSACLLGYHKGIYVTQMNLHGVFTTARREYIFRNVLPVIQSYWWSYIQINSKATNTVITATSRRETSFLPQKTGTAISAVPPLTSFGPPRIPSTEPGNNGTSALIIGLVCAVLLCVLCFCACTYRRYRYHYFIIVKRNDICIVIKTILFTIYDSMTMKSVGVVIKQLDYSLLPIIPTPWKIRFVQAFLGLYTKIALSKYHFFSGMKALWFPRLKIYSVSHYPKFHLLNCQSHRMCISWICLNTFSSLLILVQKFKRSETQGCLE